MQAEKQIENAILSYLDCVGIYPMKINNVGIYDHNKKTYRLNRSKYHRNGISDIIFLYKCVGSPPYSIFLEIKTKSGRVSEAQKEFCRNITSVGGIYFIAQSIDCVQNLLQMLSIRDIDGIKKKLEDKWGL